MSRKIKVRIWDNILKKMEYTPSIRIKPNSIDGELIIWLNNWLNESTPDCEKQDNYQRAVVEQYTGLTDKNGKDIYEGDLIEEEINTGDDSIDGIYRYQVIWDEDTLCWSLSPNYGAIHKDLWETNQSREVIGNIHETIDKSNRV